MIQPPAQAPAAAATAPPLSPIIVIRGAGEMASGIARRLYGAHLRRICMLDLSEPLCVRRTVSFSTALESESGTATVEGVEARTCRTRAEVETAWSEECIAVVLTDDWPGIGMAPDVMVDATLAKRNLGTSRGDAPLVVALGPGFEAGVDCHLVVETNRGHDLGRLIEAGSAAPNTGVPGAIAGVTAKRVLRAAAAGIFGSVHHIGDRVRAGDVVGHVDGCPVTAEVDGVLRGLLRPGTKVPAGLKLGDIDPRGDASYCHTISDKARALGGAVLEAVLSHCNRPVGG